MRQRTESAGIGTKSLLAVFLVVAGAELGLSQGDPTVSVTGGQVRGTLLDGGGAVFKGIPYAQPPTGERRWREPLPVKGWAGVRPAKEFGAPCAQKANPLFRNATDEDCLFINVWAPQWPSRSRTPVMVWMPGGGNFGGASSLPEFDGERLARRGIVLVTLNYRLGAFGFFSHAALSRESPHHASGNQGILDQIAAVRWVRDNIARFGGDPTNVTIFGESAGSLDVSALMTSPLSKGLFQRAIAQSGAVILAGDPLVLSQAEKRGEAAATRWAGSEAASLGALRALSTTQILEAEPDFVRNADPTGRAFPNLGITVDGYVFPRRPADVFAAGQQHGVPFLLGNNAHEVIPGTQPPTDLKKAIADLYGPLAARAEALYGGTDPVPNTAAAQWATDTSFRCPTIAQSLWHAAAGHATYAYEFARVAAGREAMGATHAADVSYVFGTLDRGVGGIGPRAKATDVDVRVSDVMQRYWTKFAKTGNPNDGELPKWPRFDSASRAYLEFSDAGPLAKEGLRRPQCDLFIDHVGGPKAK